MMVSEQQTPSCSASCHADPFTEALQSSLGKLHDVALHCARILAVLTPGIRPYARCQVFRRVTGTSPVKTQARMESEQANVNYRSLFISICYQLRPPSDRLLGAFGVVHAVRYTSASEIVRQITPRWHVPTNTRCSPRISIVVDVVDPAHFWNG